MKGGDPGETGNLGDAGDRGEAGDLGDLGELGEAGETGEVAGNEPTPEGRPSPGADELAELRARLERREARLLEERRRRIRTLAWAVAAAFAVLLVVVWATLLR